MTTFDTLTAVLEACGPAPRRYPIEHKKGLLGHYTRYGPWKITFDPPPIPVRDCDWHFVHDDFDAELIDGTWHGNGLGGSCGSFADALNECDEIEDELKALGAVHTLTEGN